MSNDDKNPLVCTLAECLHEGNTPKRALLDLMCVTLLEYSEAGAALAADWQLKHGEPTYPKLLAWAREYWSDPAHASWAEKATEAHGAVVTGTGWLKRSMREWVGQLLRKHGCENSATSSTTSGSTATSPKSGGVP